MNSHFTNRMAPLGLATLCIAAFTTNISAQTPNQEHLADNVFGQMSWKELGPVTSGGRIVDIAVHPNKPQIFWAASASGGIWKTTNGGISFTAQFQHQHSISIGDIAVAPSNPDVLYVGTGEANNQRSSYWGDGVYKSIDGGESWSHSGLDGTDHIGRIVIHPQNEDIAFAAALGALYRSSIDRGLYRTTDGGDTWERVVNRGESVGFVDVVFDPTNPDNVFAASYERRRRAWDFSEGGEGSRIYRSQDGGNSWTELASGLPNGKLGRIGLDVFARDGQTVYACIENINPIGTPRTLVIPPIGDEPREPRDKNGGSEAVSVAIPEADAETLADPVARADFFRRVEEAQDRARRPRAKTIGGEVYRSDDGGDTWKKQNGQTRVGGSPGYYYGQMRIDPNDRDTAWVLSVPVYKTTDGGASWSPGRGRGRGGFASGLHVDNHALWIDPRDSNHCLLGNDGGISITWDGGKKWDNLPYLPILQAYTVAVDLKSPYNIYIGLQDNGTWGFPIHGPTSAGIRPTDAFKINGGDGFFTCIDPRDPDVVYSESQFGGMSRMNLRTGARSRIKPRARKGDQALRFNWSTPIFLSPHAPDTVYTGSQHLHRSRDRGDTWVTISSDLTTNDPDKKKGDVPHCTITSISESPLREGLLWIGTDDGQVWLTRDGGSRWVDMTDRFPSIVQSLWVSRVEASPHDEATAFVSFTGYREDRRSPFLFRTDDSGEEWKAIEHNLPLEPINVVRQHPQTANVLLVGTDMGVYISIDDGANWFTFGTDLPRAAVHDLVVHPREPHILIGTHGRGVFAIDSSPLLTLDTAAVSKAFHALPPSDGVLLPRAYGAGYLGARSWSTPNPFVTPTFRYLLASDSEDDVEIEVKDAAGKVLFSRKGSTDAGYHEVRWQSQRRGGRRGGGSGGFPGFGRGGSGPRPGNFAVTIRCGEQSSTQTFRVTDLRPKSSALGPVPGDASAEQGQGESRERHGGF